jgi:hypothetical protein
MKTKFLSAGLSLFLGLIPFSNSAIAAEGIPLSDVSPNHWAYTAIEKLINKYNLKLGYPDSTFRGNNNMTRYEVAALLVQVLDQLTSRKVVQEDIKILKDLGDDYSREMSDPEEYEAKLEAIEDEIDILEMEADKQATALENLMDQLPFTVSGDIAFRYFLVTEKPGDFSKQVPQARISLSVDSKPVNCFNYGVKLISGPMNNPVNPWWKFADFFAGIPLHFQRFFASYKPMDNLELTLGKFRDPFANSELFLSEDLNPQGALETLKFNEISPFLKGLTFNAGEYIINMDNVFGNSFLLNADADLKMDLSDFIGLNLKAGYHHYIGEQNIALANKIAAEKKLEPRIAGNPNTNTLDNNGVYKTSFGILNGFGKIVFRISENFPLSVSADYLNNVLAPADNQAFQISAKLGALRDPGNFFVGYNFKYLQKDANISYFVDELLEGTDAVAHEGLFGIKILPETIISATVQVKNGIKTAGEPVYTFRAHLIQGF